MWYKMVSGWAVLALLCTAAVLGSEPAQQPAAKPDPAALRLQWHRTMAALIEARSAEKPDPVKVRELWTKLQELRAQAGQRGAVPTAGGPGFRGGMANRWGIGPGRGMGLGRGPGLGPCGGLGAAWGPGFGRGAGWGAGAGWGRAFVDENQNGICDSYERLHGAP